MLDRRAAIGALLADRRDLLVVAGLGSTTYDLASLGDDDRNFYLWGAMGGAAMIGLGLALAKPNLRVVVVTGDGEMLMGMGSLATIGVQKPKNLAVVMFDNGHYGETGMQASHTQGGVDLVSVANVLGRLCDVCRSTKEVERFDDAGEVARFVVDDVDHDLASRRVSESASQRGLVAAALRVGFLVVSCLFVSDELWLMG